ncbi:MAG: sorbosone dehydrogenase family protein, partial [Verrucomicrobiota bacterium]|nr:sorbosone dehydrogenase family protein [Verrucomicrobiota bacterium]
MRHLLIFAAATLLTVCAARGHALAGREAIDADRTKDAPGVRHKITPADLPPPYQTESATNDARVVARPDGAQPQVPAGFKIEQ